MRRSKFIKYTGSVIHDVQTPVMQVFKNHIKKAMSNSSGNTLPGTIRIAFTAAGEQKNTK